MATVAAARVAGPMSGGRLKIYKWAAIAAGDTITPLIPDGYFSDVTVYFTGTFGGNMGLNGAADPALAAGSFVGMHDAETGALIATISAAVAHSVLNGAYAFQPTVGAGVGAVDVWLFCRASK